MASQEPIYCYLTDDGLAGDGTNHIAAVNGVVTPVPFWRGPSSDMWAIHRLIVMVEDNAVLTAAGYGGVGALANGVSVQVIQGNQSTGTEVIDLLDGTTISSLIDWGTHCYDVSEHTFGSGNNFFVVRWTFSNAGRPVILDSRLGEKLVVTVNDDLSTLVNHHVMIQGHEIYTADHQINTWGS